MNNWTHQEMNCPRYGNETEPAETFNAINSIPPPVILSLKREKDEFICIYFKK